MVTTLARQTTNLNFNEKSLTAGISREETVVEHFLARLRFFPPSTETAERILRLNQELGDDYIEKEFAALPESDRNPVQSDEFGADGSWVSGVVKRASAILFREDESSSEQPRLSEEEVISLFRKTLSERIYNHLAMLSRSPHAKKGYLFSIKEELTEEIAEKIGLGLYLKPGTPAHLREDAGSALLNLACEFQVWLVDVHKGRYAAPWGDIRAVEEEPAAAERGLHRMLLLTPDVQKQVRENRAVAAAGA